MAALATLSLAVAACSSADDPVAPETSVASALLSVVPAGGATGVDPSSPVVVTFDHPMMAGMEAYAALHEGEVTGPEVAGTWARSTERTTLTFTPDAPLAPGSDYTIHLGGGMMDADGHPADLGTYGPEMGGTWATHDMMGGGMGGGHMGGEGSHMGQGWQHPTNGSYGMVFTFTTAG